MDEMPSLLSDCEHGISVVLVVCSVSATFQRLDTILTNRQKLHNLLLRVLDQRLRERDTAQNKSLSPHHTNRTL